jgi:hypothetical protein
MFGTSSRRDSIKSGYRTDDAGGGGLEYIGSCWRQLRYGTSMIDSRKDGLMEQVNPGRDQPETAASGLVLDLERKRKK